VVINLSINTKNKHLSLKLLFNRLLSFFKL
jgi:hypothetical protein